MSKLYTKLKEELKALLPPTIFSLVALHLVALIRVLMLKGTGIALSTPLQITLAAPILGKAVLVADLLPFINRYPDKPLIYNIAWKTTIYVLVAMLVHYLEHLVDFWREAGSLVAGNQKLLAEIVWPHFWAIQILLVVLILMYCTMHELVRVIGRDRVREIFFGTPPAARGSCGVLRDWRQAWTRQLPPSAGLWTSPRPNIRINFLDHNKLFLLLDVMVGKLVTPELVASLEVSAPIVKDYDLYDFKLEAHIGFFF